MYEIKIKNATSTFLNPITQGQLMLNALHVCLNMKNVVDFQILSLHIQHF